MGAAVWAASTEKTTQESQSNQAIENETEKITEDSETKEDSNNTENQTAEPQSTNTEDASDSSENQTEECKIELSDDSILVDGEAISTDSESAVYAGADIVYYKEGQDALTEQAMKMMVIQRKRQPSIPSLQSQRLEPTE